MTYRTVYMSLMVILIVLGFVSCAPAPTTGEDEKVTSMGTIEVTAQLLAFPGELVDKPFYDYTFVFKYKILDVHRGDPGTDILYVGQYNPIKPRDTVVDARVEDVGGNLKKFRVGDIHRLALDAPIDDFYMGGIINRFFEEKPDPIYWAVWTNRVVR